MIAALFIAKNGTYSDLPDVDLWDQARDARTYAGPWPVVAHPPCQRWGRFWHGSTRKPHQFQLGDDDGCFAAAFAAVRLFGGVLEHPADSHAWAHFGFNRPDRAGGWTAADFLGGWTCHVEQGHYGHFSRKPTWLYAVGADLPELIWGAGPQRLHPVALERHGYAKARRIGMAAMIGGKRKTEIREATPEAFRDVLIKIAASVLTSRPAHYNKLAIEEGAGHVMKISAHLEFDTFAEAEKVFRHLGMLDQQPAAPAPEKKAEAPKTNGAHPHGSMTNATQQASSQNTAAAAAAPETTIDALKDAFRGYVGRGGGRTAATAREIMLHHGIGTGRITDARPEQYAVLKRAFDTAGPEMPMGEAA